MQFIKRMMGVMLGVVLILGMIPQVNAASYVVNGVSLPLNGYEAGKTHDNCWTFAQLVYGKLWNGNIFSSTRGTANDMLRSVGDGDLRVVNAENVERFVKQAPLGAVIRLSPSSNLDSTKDDNGHSQIIIQKDTNGFTTYESNIGKNHEIRIQYWTWSNYAKSGASGGWATQYETGATLYFKYIKWPDAIAYSDYVDVGTNFYAYIINTANWKHLTNDSNNVSLRSETGAENQVWYFERLSDGSYKITSVYDGKCMEVCNFGTTNGTNVQTLSYSGNTAQQWYISGTSGSYVFRAKCANTVLNVDKGSAEEGTNIQMWTYNGTNAQLFQLWKLDNYKLPAPRLQVSTSAYGMPDNNYLKNEPITISWNSVPGADYYWLEIVYAEGEGTTIFNQGIGNKTSYTFTPAEEGFYWLILRSCNSTGSSYVGYEFNVHGLSAPNLTASASAHGMTTGNYLKNEPITISWNSVPGADYYWLEIVYAEGEGTTIFNQGIGNKTSYTFTPAEEGFYWLILRSCNSTGSSYVGYEFHVRDISSMHWLSKSSMGDPTYSFLQGDTVYLNYKLYDKMSGALLYSYYDNNFPVTLSIIDSNGTLVSTKHYAKDDNDSLSYKCTVAGTYTAKVDYNGTIYTETFTVLPAELKFSGASLTLQDNLAINYKVSKSLFEGTGYTNPYVKFVLNDVETVVTEYTVVGDNYVFDFTDIAPHMINDTVYATLYATYNGVEYASAVREYSVATYCYNMLGKYTTEEYAELQTLLVDLLNYGAKTQEYLEYQTDNLANAQLTTEQAAWGTSTERTFATLQDTKYEAIENPSVQWKGVGLTLQDSITMRFKIAAESIEGLTVKVTCAGGEWTVPAADFELIEEGSYYVYFDTLSAAQMSEPVYLTVYNGETAVSHTIRYSVESYVYAKQNDTDTNLVALVRAMMKYGDSAYAYVN